jgi:prephenate dehydrogenase
MTTIAMPPGGFTSVCIIGTGLIGGSIAAALKAVPNPPLIFGVDVDAGSLEHALEHGLVDEAALVDDACERGWFGPGEVSLIVVATPAQFAEGWLERIGAEGYDGVVTDVASTKGGIVRTARRVLKPPVRFVGGHPMAGSERSGIQAARPDLFANAYWLLTPSAETDTDVYRRVHEFVSALGARVISVDPRTHDEAVAIVSHVPHVAAAALVDVAAAHAGEGKELLRLAAGGFKDTTRIAAGSADLWTGICLDNADALAAGLRELRGVLGEFEAMVRGGDREEIRRWLADAADVRRSLPAQWVPATTTLRELKVPMLDRPGVVAEITGAASALGCNIEGIDIDHVSEDTAVLVLVLTDEGDVDGLVRELAELGYEPRLETLDEAAAEEVGE